MKGRKRARAAGRNRAGRGKPAFSAGAAQFLRRTLYYLKADRFLGASVRILCEAEGA